MKKQTTRLLKRSFRRVSDRKLSNRDLTILEFLWMWKAASTPMLKEVAFPNESHWWVYKALRQLKGEKYIQLLPRGRNLDLEVWALTKNGFEVVLMDRDDIEQYRYRVHAPAHDYFATCLQLGDLWQSNLSPNFLSEQQLSALAPWNFPSRVRSVDEHIPDGVTSIRGPIHEVFIGYEVDINLKEESRYESTFRYYADGLRPQLIVWLVRSVWLAERIFGIIAKQERHYDNGVGKVCAFILLDDFKEKIWGARSILGPLKGMSVSKLHANLVQTLGKERANLSQKPMKGIFFPRFKSPQKSMVSTKLVDAQNSLTPYGSRVEINLLNSSQKNESTPILIASSQSNHSMKEEVSNE